MTTTRTRSRGHTGSRASAARAGAERRPMIVASVAGGVILLAFAALVTSIGHIVLAATDHFMLKYSGVFALMLLTGTTCMGVLATDRTILNPGHRVIAQAVHRAMAFGTLAFLVVHIVLEITAPHLEESSTVHVHVLDAFIPFLSQYRTFYMAEGTIASDLIILLIITGIFRRRFTVNGNAWKWRAIHYTNYAALILGVLHGLLAGRKAIGTFVYWSYGAVLAMLAIAVLVRILATSLRSKDMVAGAAPLPDNRGSGSAQSMPARAAALGLMGQMSGAVPLGGAARTVPALQGGSPGSAASFASPYGPVAEPARAVAALPDPARPGLAPPGPAQVGRLPRYEPGYAGPPRYEGAPAPHVSDRVSQGPVSGYPTGPQPAYRAGSRPSNRTGPQPVYGSGPQPPYRTGPPPAHETGPQPAYRTGPEAAHGSGPQSLDGTGPQPALGTGPRPSRRTGPQSAYRPVPEGRRGTGPQPVYPPSSATGPQPVYPAGSRPDPGTGPQPVYPAGSRPDPGTGPQPVYPAGSRPDPGTGPRPVYPYPSASGYPSSSAPAGREFPAAYGTGPQARYPTGPQPVYDSGPRAGRERDYPQDHPYGADPGYGQGYGMEASFGPDQGYDAEPGDHAPDPYGPQPRRPPEGYGGPPGYRTGPGQPRSGPRRRPQPGDRPSGERTGPLPRVPSYGGDERR